MNQERRTVVATHSGTLVIGDIEIPCFVLEDRRRVVSGRGLTGAIGMKGRGAGVDRILRHPALKQFLSDELAEQLQEPIYFLGIGARATDGFEAPVLMDVCASILAARDAEALTTAQELRYAHFAGRIIEAVSRVGAVALIDEATGFQDEEQRVKLRQSLSAELPEYQLAWAMRLPDEFFRQIFRLGGGAWASEADQLDAAARLTDKLVFKQLSAGVNDCLRTTIPNQPGTGRRKWKHHQFLSEDIGQQDLRDHILQLVTIMKVSEDWKEFGKNFRRLFPGPQGKGLIVDLDRLQELQQGEV